MAKIKKFSIWKTLDRFLNRKNKTDDDTTLYFIHAATVIDSNYDSGTGKWYRIYSDGFCMQGGRASGSNVYIGLSKTFSFTPYNVNITTLGTNSVFYAVNINSGSGFTVYGSNSTFTYTCYGYINL